MSVGLALAILTATSAAKREGVVKFGTTMGPEFVRAEGKRTSKCASDQRAFQEGSKCCAKYGRPIDPEEAPDCPAAGDYLQPFLSFDDPSGCCDPLLTSDCPGHLCTSDLPGIR